MTGTEPKQPSLWSSALFYVFVGVLIAVLFASCTGKMPPSPEDRCEASGGVWEYKIHDCMDPEVYKKF